MATVINNPGQTESSDSGMGAGLILGIIVAILIIGALFFMYGWPAIRGGVQNPGGTNINVQIPNPLEGQNNGSPQPAQ